MAVPSIAGMPRPNTAPGYPMYTSRTTLATYPDYFNHSCLFDAVDAGTFVFQMLQRQEVLNEPVDRIELSRYVVCLSKVYGGASEAVMAELAQPGPKVDLPAWLGYLANMPGLKAALEADFHAESQEFGLFRSNGDQLAKLMGNLERLRRELLSADLTPEREAAIKAEMRTRKNQCKKLRRNGICPTPGYVCFNQIDHLKLRRLSRKQLERLIQSLTVVYKNAGIETMDEIMAVLDQDSSGDIDEAEWAANLKKLPKLYACLQQDIDPDWGILLSYRTKEDMLAKNMANLERIRRIMNTDLFSEWPASYPQLATFEERKAWIEKEMRQRKDACKEFRAKGICPSPGYVVFNQIDVAKSRNISRKQLERLVKSLTVVYKKAQIEDMDKIMQVLDADNSGGIDDQEWSRNLRKLPQLYAVIASDVDPDWGVLKSYRTHEDQLAKNMANLERLRRVLNTDLFVEWPASYPQLATYEERKAWVDKEMRQRKDACKEFRKKGIVPSPGYVVFNQIDVAKTRRLSRKQLERLIKSLNAVYGNRGIEDMDKIMKVLDADGSGDIDDNEWVQNLKKIPILNKVLSEDVDPDWGVLQSYRTHEDQLAKNMANLERLRRILNTDLFAEWPASYPQLATFEERKAWVDKEMRQRKDACKEYRKKGIVPSPGYVVFNQIDIAKTRQISRAQLERLVKSLKGAYKDKEIESIDKIMGIMDADASGAIDDQEWVKNLKKLPMLNKAVTEDVDPDWGILRSYRTIEDQLAKLLGNISRLEAEIAGGATDKAEELESRKAQAAVHRAKGVIPSPGVCVFGQLDADKNRTLDKAELAACIAKVCPGGDIDGWFAKLAPDGQTELDEATWLKNVKHIPELLDALTKDIDPDTGRLRSC